jgi:hypothetical protein
LFALAVLASRAGQVVTMPELAEGIRELGGVQKRVTAPDARDLRYKILRPFRKALAGVVDSKEIERLVESVDSSGMRLNVVGGVRVIGATTASRAAE